MIRYTLHFSFRIRPKANPQTRLYDLWPNGCVSLRPSAGKSARQFWSDQRLWSDQPEMAPADFFANRTAHGPEPLAQ